MTQLQVVPCERSARVSAYRVEAAEPGNLAVWTTYAVIVKILSGLESRVQ
jgi:hypothetical protein